jgi:hypothetical protein
LVLQADHLSLFNIEVEALLANPAKSQHSRVC